jgi:putative transposase
MSKYRRWRVPGATYYFEVCLEHPAATLLHDRLGALSDAWAGTAQTLPFLTESLVITPNLIRTIWTLPPGDSDFSERWRQIKYRFSRQVPDRVLLRPSLRQKRERGLWQRRYWEHVVRDETDLALHLAECQRACDTAAGSAFAHFEPFDSGEGFPFVREADERQAA